MNRRSARWLLMVALFQLCWVGCGEDNPCPSDSHFCDMSCVDYETDDNHCGKCGNACGVYSDCYSGICNCITGHADCDEDLSTGCEVDITTDTEHCGDCGNACGTGQSCVDGECQ